INMMMASRLLYGMSKQGVLPPFLSKVLPGRRTPWAAILFTTAIALGLTSFVSIDPDNPIAVLLGGTTSLLLLAVFAVVNVCVLVLRRTPVEHGHFRTPTVLPILGAVLCVYLVLPWTSGRPVEQYEIAGILLVIGLLLWAVTFIDRRVRGYARTAAIDPEQLDDPDPAKIEG
ncbi:MAG: amino acid permease, partial [Herbiconiux sp.]|nr:amino acid permease [Herbiconiux sp.]